jgi:hypothetical protein
MLKRGVNLIVFSFMTAIFSHCKEPYQFDTSSQASLLVVDGNISDQPGPYLLNLATTTSAQTPPSPVLGAAAVVTDNLGNSEHYVEVGNGVYQLNGTTIQGVPGRYYTLNITLANGKNYYSNKELMPAYTKPVDSVYFSVITQNTVTNNVEIANWFVDVLLNTTFQKNVGYFRWTVNEVYYVATTCAPGEPFCPQNCYVYQPTSTYKLNVIDLASYSGKSIQNILLINRGVDFSFDTRHYFNVTQFGMNSSVYNYWKAVEQLTTNVGTIFQTPPYTIRGNMQSSESNNEIVLGYFEASTQHLTRKYIDRGNIPTFIQSCQYGATDFLPGFNFCTHCLILPGSTYTQPSWFW